jgi:hypothetical protein
LYDQVEMTGSNIFDYIYRHDQQELADKLHLTAPSSAPAASAGYRSSLSPSSDTGESTDSGKEPASADVGKGNE